MRTQALLIATLLAGCASSPPPAAAAAKAKEVADALAELEASAAKAEARWTPALRAKVKKLAGRRFARPADALAAILASEHRTPGHPERDVHRHPFETLMFFG